MYRPHCCLGRLSCHLRQHTDSNLLGLGDKGYVGLSEAAFCPFKGRGKPQWKQDTSSDQAKLHSR
ncbi:hypothetical protein [Nocardiopsis sp. YSL2]|uniref:hypothetical protein n=1 Tax=Nocardiopsis sp. YSL2 TaxID=2939492 RepID=UPI0026F442C6|nr:hypothetical protein [Nocardiopsis sp. YSL2]